MNSSFVPCTTAGTTLVYEWDPLGILLSLFISLGGSLGSVQLIEALRTEGDIISRRVILGMFSVTFGAIGVFFLHFMGMLSLELGCPEDPSVVIEQRFDIGLTIFSFFAVVFCLYLGCLIVTKYDPFFGKSKKDAVKALSALASLNALVKGRKRARIMALFKAPQYLVLGGSLVALGALSMHYFGMKALYTTSFVHQHGSDEIYGFEVEWNFAFVGFSCVMAVVIGTVGLWVIFRALQWQPEKESLRFLGVIVLSLAVATLHYSAMHAATYRVVGPLTTIPDSSGTISVARLNKVMQLVFVVLGVMWPLYVIMHGRKRHRIQSELLLHEISEVLKRDVLQAASIDVARTNVQLFLATQLRSNILSSSMTASGVKIGSSKSRSRSGSVVGVPKVVPVPVQDGRKPSV